MRRILAGVGLVLVALLIGGIVGHATAASFDGTGGLVPNDYWTSGVDTVSSSASWKDTLVPDGESNYAVTVITPSDAGVAGVYVNLSLTSGNANTGWMLLRDEIGIFTWDAQVDTIFVRGAGAADSTGWTRYEVIVKQENH